MRLIDADALTESIDNITWYHINKKGELVKGATTSINPVYRADDIYNAIDKAPTIDISETIGSFRNTAYQNGLTTGLYKRTKCRWLYPYIDNIIGKRRVGKSIRVCSNCKESFNNNIPWNANFCPNCGAEVIKNEG